MRHRHSAVVAVALLLSCGESLQSVDPALHSVTPTYAGDVAPILRQYCVSCHDGDGARLGGVELDRYESAYSNRVRNVCTSIEPDLVEPFAEHLFPERRDPQRAARIACGPWAVYSMPPKAMAPLPRAEQIVLLRWLATGAPR